MSQEVEQIKDRLPVVDLIREYLKLEKAGVNYRALCPFHNEKTPSFTVNPERNFWYCFGCQEGGDIFDFVQKIEGIDFREALEKLAAKAQVELPRFQSTDKQSNKKRRIIEALEITTKIYQHNLFTRGQSVLSYLEDRGFTKEVIKKFRLGLSFSGWRQTLDYLRKQGFREEELTAAGLVIRSSRGGFYDRFRSRITFPIIDLNGRVVGYSARLVPGQSEEEKGAKYINSPQTIVYDKSKILYGLYQARADIRRQDYVILVEGNADAVLSQAAGVKNVVAISGTALTVEQITLIKRYTRKVMLCFDQDVAGAKATQKSIPLCLQHDLEVKVITLPEGFKDVGDLVAAKPSKWPEAIRRAQPVLEYYFDFYFRHYDLNQIQDKKLVIRKLLAIIQNIVDPVEQSYWLKKLAAKTQTEEELLTSLLEKVKLKNREGEISANKQGGLRRRENPIVTRVQVLQQRLLALIFAYLPELSNEVKEAAGFLRSSFVGQEKDILERLLIKKSLGDYEQKVNKYLMELTHVYDQGGWKEAEINPKEEWKKALTELKKEEQKRKIKKLELALKKAEEEGREEEAEKLLLRLKKILNTAE